MRLRPRLILVIGLATLLPLSVAGLATSRIALTTNLQQAKEQQSKQANGLAVYTATWLDQQLRSLQLTASPWDLVAMTPAQLLGLQRLVYRQNDSVNVVALLDAQGAEVASPLYLSDPKSISGDLAAHQVVGPERAKELLSQLPVSEALAAGVALGGAYTEPEGGQLVLPVAAATQRSEAVIGAEVALAGLQRHFLEQRTRGGAAVLLDKQGRPMVGETEGLVSEDLLRSFTGQLQGELRYPLDGEWIQASFQSVGPTGWSVVVAVPEAIAAAGARNLFERTAFVYALAALLAAALGYTAAGGISGPVERLRRAVQRLGQGELGRQVPEEGDDELTQLAQAFNEMSTHLKANHQVIEAKNQEIASWNQQLQLRVDERTAQLKASQHRLVGTARMAAVAEMGAGLAHELNNPMAGILGLAQVAKLRAGDGELAPMLASIEEQALRCRDILATLGRFTGKARSAEGVPLDLNALLAEVLGLVGGAFSQSHLTLEHKDGLTLPTVGDPALLAQALTQLLRSLRAALGPGGALVVAGERDEGVVRLVFTLTGALETRSDDWFAYGMGFWTARQVLEEHGGGLEEPAERGATLRYALELPAR